MPTKLRKKAADLAKELKIEIKRLEHEVTVKKGLLETLGNIEGKLGGTRKIGRRTHWATKKAKGKGNGRRTRSKIPTRRKSKNRDIVLEAASKLKGKFSLAQLKDKILDKSPKFGGTYASGTILAVLRTTPEIKKLKRGTYTYKS
jgi:hypothetical protein